MGQGPPHRERIARGSATERRRLQTVSLHAELALDYFELQSADGQKPMSTGYVLTERYRSSKTAACLTEPQVVRDAVAIVSRQGCDTLFSANVKSTHSAVLLPQSPHCRRIVRCH